MYIGLDVGTSGCKAAVVNEAGEILAAASRAYAFEFPRRGWVELNPHTVWAAVRDALREIAGAAGGARAIAVSSIGEALVMLDEQDQPLSNAIVYLDNRAEAFASEVRARFDPAALFELTGVPVNQMYSLPKLLWMKAHAPDALNRARRVFLFGDFLTYLLSGERAVDPATASRTMMFNVHARAWSEAVFARFDLPMAVFSPVAPTGTAVGRILPSVARELGLPASLQVVVGAHDQVAATLGSGVLSPGDLLMGEGSTESLNLVVSEEQIRRETLFAREICMEPFVEPGRFIMPIGQLSHGTSIKWFVEAHRSVYEAVAESAESLYETADRLMAEDSGRLHFLPYLSGVNCMDASSRAPACFIGVDCDTTVHSMYRAVLEGLSFETRSNMRLFDEANVPVYRIVASGGGAKSKRFMKIKADALQKPIATLDSADSGVMGLAMICAKSLGDCPSYREAADAFVRTRAIIAPEGDYAARYAQYLRVAAAMKELFRADSGMD
jgi:xylulokinase